MQHTGEGHILEIGIDVPKTAILCSE